MMLEDTQRPQREKAAFEALRQSMRVVDAMLRAREYPAACERLEGIVKAYPDYAEARRLLGGAYLALGDFETAERTLGDAVAVDPGWGPASTTLGEFLLARGRFVEAEVLLRQALEAARPDPCARAVLANYCNNNGRWDEVLALVPSMDVNQGVEPALAWQRACALIASGRAEQAISESRAIATRPGANHVGDDLVAWILSTARRDREAEPLLRRVLQRAPANPELQFAHARTLTALGRLEEAEAAWMRGLRQAPQDAAAYDQLARLVWLRSGDCTTALAPLDAALQHFGDNDALWATRAAVLQAAGEPEAAWRCLAPRVERPQAAPALIVRAGLAALEFDSSLALRLAERAGKMALGNASAATLRAAALLGVGDAQAALNVLAGLCRAAPNDQYLAALQTTAWRMLDDARYAQWCDYASLVVPYQLEAPAGWAHLDDFLHDLAAVLDQWHAGMAHRRLFQSLRRGTETVADLAASEHPVVQALFHAFDAPIADYMARLGHGEDTLRARNNGRYRFNGGWSVRLREQGFHDNHVHPSGWISSACYIRLPRSMAGGTGDEGVLQFAAPGVRTEPVLPAQYRIRPRAGMLVLFPSYAWHGTVPFHGDDTRLTVAFDVVPAADSRAS